MLFAFYTAQLSFLPAALGAILIPKEELPDSRWVGWSMLISALGGIGLGLYSTFFNSEYQWYPVIYTIITSSLIYFLGWLKSVIVRNYRNNEPRSA